jgi:hypothetical protein
MHVASASYHSVDAGCIIDTAFDLVWLHLAATLQCD